MVDATTAALMEYSETDDFFVFESFITHYARQPEESLPPSCTKLYDRVVERMRADEDNADTTVEKTVDAGILTIGLFALTIGLLALAFIFNSNS